MGYPGNQGQHGGWQTTRPPYGREDDEPASPFTQPQPPYGQADDEPAATFSQPLPPYGRDDHEPAATFSQPLPPYGMDDQGPASPFAQPRPPYGQADEEPAAAFNQPQAPYDPYDQPTVSAPSVGSPHRSVDGDEQYFRPAGPSGLSGAAEQVEYTVESADFGESRSRPSREPARHRADEAIGYGQTRGRGGPEAPGQGRRRRRLVLIGSAAVLAVTVVGGGTAILLSGGSGPAKGPEARKPAGPGAGQPPGATPQPPNAQELAKNIRSREIDPRPLSLSEVFRQTKFSEAGKSYLMTTRRADRKCANAVTGKQLEAALQKARCTQLLRASFTTTGGKLIGTIGIANLSTEKAAQFAARAAGGGRNYVEPLRGSGNTRTLGRRGSNAVGTADVRGHYLILSWVQYPNGRKIAKEHYSAISGFERNVIVGSDLGTALGQRMIANKQGGAG